MTDKLVSIIVPVYNVEKYIARCLESLVSQTYTDIQIIIVNDGTKDNSMSIVSSYAKKDQRIEIYDKDNGGLSDARNYGLRHTKGSYICFVDSDDWVANNYVSLLKEQFDADSKVDISIVDFDYAYQDGLKQREYQLDNVLFGNIDGLEKLCVGKEITNHVWNKMYKKELFIDIQFEKGRKYEDIYIMHQLFNKARKISSISSIGYHYYMRDNSILHEKSPQNDMDIFIGYKNRYDFIADQKLKQIVLKYCAWSGYKVLYIHENENFDKRDLQDCIDFWNNHKEIATLGIKYFFMYKMPNIYRKLIR